MDQSEATKNGGEVDVTLEAFSSDSDSSQDSNQQAVVCFPSPIEFPRFTEGIDYVSCGQAHALALTKKHRVFSWGCGSYGALGFGDKKDQLTPRQLKIDEAKNLPVIQVSCGRMHSICVTDSNRIYSWGCGQNGRLGHGSTDDELIPKEILFLSHLKVIDASAGESHSAAVTKSLKVYTWGNGVFGRLGLGFDTQEESPKHVEDLDVPVVQVSCGAFHTLVLTQDRNIVSFGQNKYGKLGINTANHQSIVRALPV